MTRKILDIGFALCALHRIDLRVYDFNSRAISCYERVGFLTEDVLRNSERVDGEYWNTIVMRMLAEEWEERYGSSKTTEQSSAIYRMKKCSESEWESDDAEVRKQQPGKNLAKP